MIIKKQGFGLEKANLQQDQLLRTLRSWGLRLGDTQDAQILNTRAFFCWAIISPSSSLSDRSRTNHCLCLIQQQTPHLFVMILLWFAFFFSFASSFVTLFALKYKNLLKMCCVWIPTTKSTNRGDATTQKKEKNANPFFFLFNNRRRFTVNSCLKRQR